VIPQFPEGFDLDLRVGAGSGARAALQEAGGQAQVGHGENRFN
jgi:hypothetical protein